jgi:ferric-dicitrate binding protein FerR (iron transport regulator)
VRLGPESKLTVPRRFGIGLRAVKIEGTANFEVTRTLDQPFDVRSGPPRAIIVATGTRFTVRRYRDDAGVVVHVGEGTVEMTVGEETRTVAQGTALAVDTTGAMTVPSQEVLDETSAWVDGNVTIVGRPLRYVLPRLKRWYGLDVRVPDARLLDRQVFLRAALNSPREAITSIERSGGLKFTYIGENMAFEDTVPSRPARRR